MMLSCFRLPSWADHVLSRTVVIERTSDLLDFPLSWASGYVDSVMVVNPQKLLLKRELRTD
jgi:hypothetical protein